MRELRGLSWKFFMHSLCLRFEFKKMPQVSVFQNLRPPQLFQSQKQSANYFSPQRSAVRSIKTAQQRDSDVCRCYGEKLQDKRGKNFTIRLEAELRSELKASSDQKGSARMFFKLLHIISEDPRKDFYPHAPASENQRNESLEQTTVLQFSLDVLQ